MLIDLLDKLIDRCIQLAKRSEEVSRHLFSDFVDPVHVQFEAVHTSYLESFRRYRSLIQNANSLDAAAPAILDQVRADSLFTANQRTKVRQFLAMSSSPLVRDFVASKKFYFDQSLSGVMGSAGYDMGLSVGLSNIWRGSLLESLEGVIGRSDLTEAEKRESCVRHLDWLILRLQESYSAEVEAYSKLRGDLLRPA